MKYLSILLLLISFQVQSESIVKYSYKEVKIGMLGSEAIKQLKSLKSTAHPEESDSSCYYLESTEKEDQGIGFMVQDGRISRIDVFKNKNIKTEQGIHIGSTKSEVLKKYKKVTVTSHPYMSPHGEYLEVKLTDKLGVIFETENDIITSFRVGDDSIQFIEGCA